MKKILSWVLGALLVAAVVQGARTTVDTSTDTFQTAWERTDNMFIELYGKWTALGTTHDTSGELDALYEAELDNSAGLAAALSDETGTGSAVFATSPTLVTPALGTPSALVLTNATGLPYSALANGTDGNLITWGADAAPAVVATGTVGQVLTSAGAGAPPTFEDATGGGYTDLTSFIEQTAWRIFYSDGSGDVTELALGDSGKVLKSNGAAVAPSWETDSTGAGGDQLVDIVATSPLLVNGGANVNDALPGSDADVTFSLPAATNAVPGYATAAQITALEAIDTEAELEALLELQDLQGAVTDSQVPNDITITGLSGTNSGDNAANSTYTIGSATQAYSAYLLDIAELTPTANNLLGWNSAGTDIENKSTLTLGFISSVEFEGSTADDGFQTTITVTDPTADRTITVRDDSGTMIISGDTFTGDVTGTLDTDGSTALTIASNIIDEDNLEATNSPTDNYVLSYDLSSGGFTWVEDATGGPIADDSLTVAKMSNGDWGAFTITTNVAALDANSVDSDQYVDGSIDNAHLADDAVGTAEIATDAVTMDAVDADGNFTSLTGNWGTTGVLTGRLNYGADITANTTHDTTEVHNAAYHFTAAATVTLDAAADAGYGAVVSYRVRDAAEAAVIDVQAAEKINLDGTPLDPGTAITATGAGSFVTLMSTTDTDGSGTDGWEVWGNNGFESE